MENKEEIPQFPRYNEIVQTIAENLRFRKKLLFKRTFRIIWPGIAFILLSFLIITLVVFTGGKFLKSIWFWSLIVLVGISLLFLIIYYLITAWIFSLERLIWIKSYFDRKNLLPEESWRQAKRIAWPAFIFMLKIFFKFYFLPILLFIGITIVSLIIILKLNIETSMLMLLLCSIIGITGIPIALYIYYIRIKKLRFVWFVFLDFHKETNFSFEKIMKINQDLNQICQGEVFKRALMWNLGIDATEVAIRSIMREVESILTRLAKKTLSFSAAPPVVGVAKSIEMFTEELTKQASELSRAIAMYILYQYVLLFKT